MPVIKHFPGTRKQLQIFPDHLFSKLPDLFQKHSSVRYVRKDTVKQFLGICTADPCGSDKQVFVQGRNAVLLTDDPVGTPEDMFRIEQNTVNIGNSKFII